MDFCVGAHTSGHSEGFGLVGGSRFEIFPIQMNLSEFDSGTHNPATPAHLWETVGGYMRERKKKRKKRKGKEKQDARRAMPLIPSTTAGTLHLCLEAL